MNYYTIEENIIKNKNLNSNDKIIYAYIRQYSKGNKKICYTKNKTMSEDLGISERTISQSLQKLKKLQIIEIGYQEINSNKKRTLKISSDSSVVFNDSVFQKKVLKNKKIKIKEDLPYWLDKDIEELHDLNKQKILEAKIKAL